MSKVIIHISDLHITDYTGVFGKVNNNTFLDTNSENSSNFSFIEKLVEKIKEKFSANEKILIITGDITNLGEKSEFDQATNFISKLASDLSIDKSKIILVPGDHDVHRDSVRNGLREEKNKGKKGHELLDEKYKNFGEFYQNLKTEEFDVNKIIFNSVEIDDNILLLCANSNFLVGQDAAPGFIPIQKFDSELIEIIKQNENKELLLAFHHNISGIYQDKISGQWDLENRKDLIHLLEKHKIKCVFYGNEHTPRSTKLDSTEIYISEPGAVSGIKPLGTFKCYEIHNSKNLIQIQNHFFSLMQSTTVNETKGGDWIEINPPSQKKDHLNDFIILDNTKNLTPEDEITDLPSLKVEEEKISSSQISELPIPIYYKNDQFSDGLYEIVKNKKLFHTGHFHWSETSRAHNWIDISKLLESKENLHFVKDSIIDVIESFNLMENCDLIIGLGYEGNIISTKASIKYNIPYTSLPYSYRYNDHNDFEKNLNYDNTNGDYKTVIIITDVVNDGRTIRKLIGKRCDDFFKNVDRIIVISLFYTGEIDEINTDILNYDKRLPNPNYDFENEHSQVNNIEFYTVRKLKVDKCPYGKNYSSECLIYKDGLSCVHLFYDTEK